MSAKMDFATSLAEEGSHGFLGMTACEKFGMAYGCQPDCPVFQQGKCELQAENQAQFEREETQP